MQAGRVAAGFTPGFTLLEVAIVVAIIAVITAAAVPSWLRFQRDNQQLAEQQMELLQAMSGEDVKALITAPGYPDDPSNPIDPDPEDDALMAFAGAALGAGATSWSACS